MAPSSAQIAGTTFTAITHRFQTAISFDPDSKGELIILHCLLGIQVEETVFKNAVQRVLETDQRFDEIEWSMAESLLKSKLGAQYMVYNDCIERVLASVSALAILTHPDYSKTDEIETHDILNLSTTVSWSEENYNKFLLAVLDVDSSIEKQIKRLRNANQKLNSIKVEKATGLRKEFKRFDKIRTKLSAAATILGPKFGFDCPCHQKHAAFIKMPEWPQSQVQPVDERFSILFQNHANSCLWKCIEMTSDVIQIESVSERGQDVTHGRRIRRQVRFARDGFQMEKDADTITINVPTESGQRFSGEAITDNISILQHTELSRSPSLCEYIASNQKENSQLGKANLVMNAAGLSLRMSPTEIHGSASSLLRLELQFFGHGGRSLTTLERLKLATQVASGVLCLYATTWLTESWSSADIYLWYDNDNVEFIPWTVNCHNAASLRQTSDKATSSLTDPTTLSLCRFLVELWFGAPWSNVKKVYGSCRRSGEGEDAADRDVIETILSWASDETINPHDRPFYEEGRLYADAVRNCLECDFGQVRTSITDRTFREGVYNKILCPLRWALEDFQARQLLLFGANRDCAAGEEIGNRKMTSGVTLYDEDGDVDSTKDANTDKWFESYLEVKKVVKRIRTDRPNKPEQRIRVAVLDTGVNVNDPFLNPFAIKRRIIYKDFAQPGSSSGLPVDEVGHGTHICGTLLTVADNIDVYVARVSVDGKLWNGLQVAEAIKWAVEEKEVHIISMSFGFPYTIKQLNPIRRAILKANAADVLIFAAASNKGGNQPVAFPACMDEVICVGSTDGRGIKSDFTPNLPQGKRLCVLGERIESSWPPEMVADDEDVPRKSGTSFATPVAAGVAATVLEYMWTFKDDVRYKSLITKLLTRRGMLSVFKQMVEEYPTHDYLVPWKLFSFQLSGDMDQDENEDSMDFDESETLKMEERMKPGMGIVEKIVGILRLL